MPLLTQNHLQITSHSLTLPRLPTGFDGFRMIHISDLHFYQYTHEPFYQNVVDTINELNADLIAMTGDVIHYGPKHIPLAAKFLSQMNASEGKVAVIGNHDFFDTAASKKIETMLTQSGFSVLRNTHLPLSRPGNDKLWISGVDDLKYGRPDIYKALSGIPSREEATLMLSHNPLLFDPVSYLDDHQVDLMLAGHTHAGHVYLPFLGPIYQNVFKMKYRYGLYQKGNTQMYLTSGLGSAAFYCYRENFDFALPRFRHNTYPEIAVLTLKAPSS